VYDRTDGEKAGDRVPADNSSLDSRVSGTITVFDVMLVDPRKFDLVSTIRTKPGAPGT
jgi:hypothetical protein